MEWCTCLTNKCKIPGLIPWGNARWTEPGVLTRPPLVFWVFGSHHGPINHAVQLAMVTTFEYGVAESSFFLSLMISPCSSFLDFLSISPPTWSPQIAALPQAWLEVSFLLNKSSSFIWLPKAVCMFVYIIKTEISDAFKGWLAPAPWVQIQPFLPLLYVLCMFSCMFSLCLCGFSLGILAYTQSSGYG